MFQNSIKNLSKQNSKTENRFFRILDFVINPKFHKIAPIPLDKLPDKNHFPKNSSKFHPKIAQNTRISSKKKRKFLKQRRYRQTVMTIPEIGINKSGNF